MTPAISNGDPTNASLDIHIIQSTADRTLAEDLGGCASWFKDHQNHKKTCKEKEVLYLSLKRRYIGIMVT